jgi:hypothetical protein
MTTETRDDFKIQIMYGNGEHMLPVKGKPVVVPGFEHHKFFLHRPVYDITKDEHGNVVPVYSGGWAITEATTGKNLGRAADTKAEAIDHAKTILNAHRVDFEKALAPPPPVHAPQTATGTAQTAHREPWETPKGEYLSRQHEVNTRTAANSGTYLRPSEQMEMVKGYDGVAERAHMAAVSNALKSGKPVPAEVLKDYPELGKKETLSVATKEEVAEMIRQNKSGGVGTVDVDAVRKTLATSPSPTKAYADTHAETTKRIKSKESRGGDQNAAIHAWYDDTEEERRAHDRIKATPKEKPRFSIRRKASGGGRGQDLGADIVRDRHGRHLRL